MGRREHIIKKVRKFRKEASKEIPIEKLILFGSQATGKAKEYSDVDLIVVSRIFKEMKFFERPVRLTPFLDYEYPVDFLCYTPDEFDKLSRQITIVLEAVREGIEIK